MFFELIDVAFVNSHTVYTKRGNDISLLNFKIAVAKALIGRYSNRKRLFPTSRPNLQKSREPSMPIEHARVPGEANEMPLLQLLSLLSCQTCDLYLCLTKEKKCLKHHLQFSITITLLIIYLYENKVFLCCLVGFFLL